MDDDDEEEVEEEEVEEKKLGEEEREGEKKGATWEKVGDKSIQIQSAVSGTPSCTICW